jgi:hypothetical protein
MPRPPSSQEREQHTLQKKLAHTMFEEAQHFFLEQCGWERKGDSEFGPIWRPGPFHESIHHQKYDEGIDTTHAINVQMGIDSYSGLIKRKPK